MRSKSTLTWRFVAVSGVYKYLNTPASTVSTNGLTDRPAATVSFKVRVYHR